MIIFKLPFKDYYFTTDENQEKNFINFFSFDAKTITTFNGNIKHISKDEILNYEISSKCLSVNSGFLIDQDKNQYTKKLKKVIEFIKKNELKKLVISRIKTIKYSDISLTKTFLNLGETYPNAFTYLWIKNNDCWMGAFSEILGKFNKDTSEFETMSLAGTLPLNEEWTEKEILEQKPVTEYIKNILQEYTKKEVKPSETYNHISGNIKHLRTDFKVEINYKNLDQLISKLHPTPAVCGIPKDFCQSAIHDFEAYSREFYAGYSKIETTNEIYYFVNLRCGKFFKNSANLYVGGGITSKSNAEKEWVETELKAEALLKNMVIS